MRRRSAEESVSVEDHFAATHILIRVCTGIDQDGKRTESFTEPDKDIRSLRKTDVLSDE